VSDALHSWIELRRLWIIVEISLSLLYDARLLHGKNLYDEHHSCAHLWFICWKSDRACCRTIANFLGVRSPNFINTCNPQTIQTVCTRLILIHRDSGHFDNNKRTYIIWYNQRMINCSYAVKLMWNLTDWMCSPMRTNKNLPTLPDLWCKHLIIYWGNTSATLQNQSAFSQLQFTNSTMNYIFSELAILTRWCHKCHNMVFRRVYLGTQ
jgi:hypothetical protein